MGWRDILSYATDPIGTYEQKRFERKSEDLFEPIPMPQPLAFQRPIARGLSNIPLDAALQNALAWDEARRGPLDPALADAIASSPALQTIRDAHILARELETTRADIEMIRAGFAAQKPTDTRLAIFEGALAGFASTGNYFGAIAGGTGGAVKSRAEHEKILASGEQLQEAGRAITPPEFERTLAGLTPGERQQVLASGEGAQIAQDLQAAISRSGMRDSSLGSLAGIAAAVAPEQVARGRALSRGLEATRRRVETILGSPVRQRGENVSEALGAVAEGFLAYSTLFPKQEKSPSSPSTLPGPEDLYSDRRPLFTIPDQEQYTTFH